MTDNENGFNLFEMCTAVLLGLAATATALVSHESGLWGGRSVEAYGEAATMTSKASNLDNSAVVEASQDSNIEIEAKKLIREAGKLQNESEKEASLNLASYLLSDFLSDAAYKAFGLPLEYRDGEKKDSYIPDDVLASFGESEGLGDEYTKDLFSEAEDLFEKADQTFNSGREANNIGDKFSFAAVLYAISLFFSGIASVLRSKVRWVVLGAGTILLVVSSCYVATLQWLPLL